MAALLKIDSHDGLLTLTLADAERRNPLSVPMQAQLLSAIASARADPKIRCLLLTGEGKAFSAGGDLEEMGTVSTAMMKRLMAGAQTLVRDLTSLPIPVVTAINGVAAGAGFALAMAGDVIIASEQANFIPAFARIGAVPDLGLAQSLVRSIGIQRTLAMLLTGRSLPASEAFALGLVTQISRPEEFAADAMAVAQGLASSATVALGLTKALVRVAAADAQPAFFDAESSAQAIAFSTDDFREGLAAIRARRAPVFCGR